MGYNIPCCGSRIKKKPLRGEGSGFMPATGRDVVVLPPKKGGTAGLARNINYETGEVLIPWKHEQT
ncbi:MAG: hypothetical protein CMH44_16025 [Muricauda sp.]|nr:hypothetical protein [Allomuricauda sp.]